MILFIYIQMNNSREFFRFLYIYQECCGRFRIYQKKKKGMHNTGIKGRWIPTCCCCFASRFFLHDSKFGGVGERKRRKKVKLYIFLLAIPRLYTSSVVLPHSPGLSWIQLPLSWLLHISYNITWWIFHQKPTVLLFIIILWRGTCRLRIHHFCVFL